MGCKHCFSLIIYGFCSSNALSSASLLFRMIIFIFTPFDVLTPFDTCCYFGLNLSLVLLIKVFFIKRHVPLFFSLLKMKICFIGMILSQKSCQKQGVWKKDEKGVMAILGGVVYSRRGWVEGSNLLHTQQSWFQ